jgi:hypothetical protein
MTDLNWCPPDAEGGTFSKSSGNLSPHGRIPYLVEKRHDGFSLSVNLLIRGLDTPERARDIAESIHGMVDGNELDEVINGVRVRVYATRSEYEVVFNDDDVDDPTAQVLCYPKFLGLITTAHQGRAEYVPEVPATESAS